MSQQRNIQLETSWKKRLEAEFEQPYMQDLRAFLLKRKAAGATVYPAGNRIFNALDSTPLWKWTAKCSVSIVFQSSSL